VYLKHFRELQSLLQQFIIVEHAVEPAMDPSAVSDGTETQMIDPEAIVDEQSMVASGIDSSVVDSQEMDASALVMAGIEPPVADEPIDMEPAALVEPTELDSEPTELDSVAMDTAADDQPVLDQTDADAANEMVMVPAEDCQPTDDSVIA